jgi:hypothetical protein
VGSASLRIARWGGPEVTTLVPGGRGDGAAMRALGGASRLSLSWRAASRLDT